MNWLRHCETVKTISFRTGTSLLWAAILATLATWLTPLNASESQEWPVAIKSECELIAHEIDGPEDLALMGHSTLVVSHTDRWKKDSKENGLCRIDIGADSDECLPMEYASGTTELAAPHGIFATGYPRNELVAIDHPVPEKSRIHRYELRGGKLAQIHDPIDLKDRNANDLVIDSLGRIFFSSPPGEGTSAWKMLSALLGFKRSAVYMVPSDLDGFDIEEADPICPRLRYPNGVALDDRNRLFIADSIAGRLYMLDQVKTSGLEQRCWAVSSLPGGDNISASEARAFSGMIVVGHPSLWKFARYGYKREGCSPSTVYAVSDDGSRTAKILKLSGKETFRESRGNGPKRPFCAGSSAILTDRFLYVGQVFGAGVLRCPVFFQEDES